jgi:hypothetical protein
MKQVLSVVIGTTVAVVWIALKWWQAKKLYTKDLGDGGVQKLFARNSK